MLKSCGSFIFFFFQAEDGIRDDLVTGVQTCALPISQRTAWRNRELLSARDRALVTAIIGPNGPDPDARVAHLQAAQQATVVAPDRADAWYYYGDDLFHDGALLGLDDPLGRAEQALQRASRIDSTQSGILQHLMLLAAYRGDTAELRRMIPRQIAAMG